MAKSLGDGLVTDLGPFEVELIGKTLRIIGADGGDVLLIGNVKLPGARNLADTLKNILNAARENMDAVNNPEAPF